MATIITGVDIALAAISRALVAAQMYNSLILTARKEGRDISPEELAYAKVVSEAATDDATTALDAAAGNDPEDSPAP